MARGHQRIGPFNADHARRCVHRRLRVNGGNSLAQAPHNIRGSILTLCRSPHGEDAVENVRQAGRLQRQNRDVHGHSPHCLADLVIADGANIAQLLRDNQAGLQCGQQLLVEPVDARPSMQRRLDVAVDDGACAAIVVEGACSHRGVRRRFRRKSHSCVTATMSSPAPIAYRISVALGSSDATRAGGVSCRIRIGGTAASMPHRAERPRRGCHRAGRARCAWRGQRTSL